ncbi:MAG TPA: DNA polymerase III subunit beta [Planctomycetota bacterium]|nr:DNA polymerase III subunit beta [Planctomycetota bacterium]
MKLVVKREPFTAALSAAAAVVPLRGARPSLKNALLVGDADGNLEIQATDMEVGLRYKLKAESIQSAASLCLPCITLSGLLKECTEEVVTLETNGPKGVLTVGRDRFEVIGQESSDFPEVPAMAEGAALTVPAAELAKMIDRTIFAAAREQGRYAINGVYMQCKDKLLEIVATDGRRLAFCKKKLKSGSIEEGIIIPIKMMQEIRKLCDNVASGEDLQIAVKGRSVLVQGGAVTLSSLVVEGIFPKYQQVIPKDNDKEVNVKRDVLMHALRKAVFLTSEETKTVQLTFSPGTCLVESRSPDKGQAAVTVEVEYNGAQIGIGFNPQYLQDALKVLGTDTVRIELKDGARPGVVREGQDYLYVLMPVNPRE